MKKLLIATLLLTGLTAFLPSAQADCRERVFVGYDRCGHPVYREVYRPRYSYYDERPQYYRAAPQARYRSYDDDRSRCREREPRRHFSPLSFVFGF
jgi:hypothetical protein